MHRFHRFVLHPLTAKVFVCLLASSYVVYLLAFSHVVTFSLGAPISISLFKSSASISDHPVGVSPNDALQYWTIATMRSATDVDSQITLTSNMTTSNTNQSEGAAVQQKGQPGGDKDYPLSTVGKIFFTTSYGQNSMCSGTAVVSNNRSVVDTAGHCLYYYNGWSRNVVFCPLYDNGDTPYGCWAARDLEVPSDWIDRKPNDFHHDFGIAIVAPNDEGSLTDIVGGAGWAYNQPTNQPFYAYGYPAGYPFDGQTRQSCEAPTSKLWQHGDGTVISIPCDMTGGSSGGPWFVKSGSTWYLNGHNDFISSIQPNHMFSPYYDDTWYAMYNKAQQE